MLNSDPTPAPPNRLADSFPAADSSIWAVVTPQGEIDLTRENEMNELVDLEWEPAYDLVVDLTEVTFIDSSCLHWLSDTQRKVEQAGRRFAVVVPEAGTISRVFEIVALDQVMAIYRNLDQLPPRASRFKYSSKTRIGFEPGEART